MQSKRLQDTGGVDVGRTQPACNSHTCQLGYRKMRNQKMQKGIMGTYSTKHQFHTQCKRAFHEIACLIGRTAPNLSPSMGVRTLRQYNEMPIDAKGTYWTAKYTVNRKRIPVSACLCCIDAIRPEAEPSSFWKLVSEASTWLVGMCPKDFKLEKSLNNMLLSLQQPKGSSIQR